MQTPEFDLSSDCFILDRDQDEYLKFPQAQSTPTIKQKTEEEHLVLHHDTAPVTILSTATEGGAINRRFTRDNPVTQDGIDFSPPRNYHEMDSRLYAPNNGTVSPISNDSSSIGYFLGSDWTTDSSWFSYDSVVQSVFQPPISSPFRPISPLPPILDVPQEGRRLPRPQRCHGIQTIRGTPEEGSKEIDHEEARKIIINLKRKNQQTATII